VKRLFCISVCSLLVCAAGASAATTWTVGPGSARMTAPCVAATPCNFVWALNSSQAKTGDTVAFLSGEYDFDGSSNNDIEPSNGVTLEPAAGDTTRPLIKQTVAFPACACAIFYLGNQDTVRGLAIDQSVSSNARGEIAATGSDVIDGDVLTGVEGLYFFGNATESGGVVQDTTITSTLGPAVTNVAGGTFNLDNDTVFATGASSVAIQAVEQASANSQLNVTNTIARGGKYDLQATDNDAGGKAATIVPTNSNFRTGSFESTVPDAPSTATIAAGANNQSATPLFQSSTYREAAGSPTIGHGVVDGGNGAADVEGFPRVLGGSVDIGASEFSGPQIVGQSNSVTGTTAALTLTINPNGLPTTVEVAYGPTPALGQESIGVPAGSGTSPIPITVPIAFLQHGTTYYYAITANNEYASETAPTGTFATLPPPALGALTLTPTKFRAATFGASISRRVPPRGTTVAYTDNELSVTTFVILAPTSGVLSGKTCVAPPKHRRRGVHYRGCRRWVPIGSFTHSDVVGANSFHFSGRTHHALAPGSYELTATPSAYGAQGATLTTLFKIVR
jgi:hypothetical protein